MDFYVCVPLPSPSALIARPAQTPGTMGNRRYQLFGSIARRIASLSLPSGWASRRPVQILAASEAGEGKLSEERVGKTAT